MVHSHITLLTQDAEQIVKAFLSPDFAKPEPSLKLALEQAKLLHLVSYVPVTCGEWHIDSDLTEDRCGRHRCRWSQYQHSSGNRVLSDQNERGHTKMAISQKLSVQLSWNFHRNLPEGVYYARWQDHNGITMGTNDDAASQKWEDMVIFMLILYKYGLRKSKWQGKILPLVFPVWSSSVWYECPSYWSYSRLCSQKKQLSIEAGVHYSALPPWFIMKWVTYDLEYIY